MIDSIMLSTQYLYFSLVFKPMHSKKTASAQTVFQKRRLEKMYGKRSMYVERFARIRKT